MPRGGKRAGAGAPKGNLNRYIGKGLDVKIPDFLLSDIKKSYQKSGKKRVTKSDYEFYIYMAVQKSLLTEGIIPESPILPE